jgi:uncharacterized membrane protein YkoI
MITTKNTKLTKLLISGTIVAAAVILLTATISSGVLAQGVNTTSRNATTGVATPNSPNQANSISNSPRLPNITGSIPLRNTISEALSSKVKASLSNAIDTAQKSVGPNTSATLGLIRPLDGYLVYDIHVKNNTNNTSYAVIVDPGNGKILYKQVLTPFFGGGMGHFMMNGEGRMGTFSGGNGEGNIRGFAGHVGSMPLGPSRSW